MSSSGRLDLQAGMVRLNEKQSKKCDEDGDANGASSLLRWPPRCVRDTPAVSLWPEAALGARAWMRGSACTERGQ